MILLQHSIDFKADFKWIESTIMQTRVLVNKHIIAYRISRLIRLNSELGSKSTSLLACTVHTADHHQKNNWAIKWKWYFRGGKCKVLFMFSG